MHRWCHYILLVMYLMNVGCETRPLGSVPWSSTSPLAGHSVAQSPQQVTLDDDKPQTVTPTPTGDLALRDAIALALEYSPSFQAYSLDIRVAEARAIQAGVWANPELEAEVENIAGRDRLSGIDAAETTITLAQIIPIGGDIQRRRDLAGIRVQRANWDYEAARIGVLAEVAQRFVEALATDRRLALANQELELARETERVVTQRVAAGDASPVEQIRVMVPVVIAEVEVKQAELMRDAAYRRLTLTWGGREVTFDRLVGDLDVTEPVRDPSLLVKYINSSPVVASWAMQISERVAERRLAEAEAMPDLTGRIGLKHYSEDDESSLVVGISLPLPLFDRREGDILAVRLGEAAAVKRRRDAELRIESMLSTAYAELIASHTESDALRNRVLPAAKRAYEVTREGFNQGGLPFLDVLDAQRTLFQLQRRYLETLVVYHTAVVEIESLIGRRLSELNDESHENIQEKESKL